MDLAGVDWLGVLRMRLREPRIWRSPIMFALHRRRVLEASAFLARSMSSLLRPAIGIWLLAAAGAATADERHPNRILYFTHSAGFRHGVIPASRDIVKRIGETSGHFEVTATEDVGAFTAENLRHFCAVMFFTTGELPLSEAARAAFTAFVRDGGGFIGVHSATDTFYEWPEYLKIIGGYFDGHPWHQTVRVEAADRTDPLAASFRDGATLYDEIYQIRDFDRAGSRVLLQLDPGSVDLSQEGVHRHPYGWPLAWTRSYGKGRVFYSALGHEEAVWRDERFQEMLRRAVRWTLGDDPP